MKRINNKMINEESKMAKTYHVILDFFVKVPDSWHKLNDGTTFVDKYSKDVSLVAGLEKKAPNMEYGITTANVGVMSIDGVEFIEYKNRWMQEN